MKKLNVTNIAIDLGLGALAWLIVGALIISVDFHRNSEAIARVAMHVLSSEESTTIEIIRTSSAVQLSAHPYAMPEELAARLTGVQFREVTAIWEFDDQNPELPGSGSWVISVENVSAFIDSLATEHLPPTLTANGTPNRELTTITVGEHITRECYYSGIQQLNWIVTQSCRKS
jgi:hypothetical protein